MYLATYIQIHTSFSYISGNILAIIFTQKRLVSTHTMNIRIDLGFSVIAILNLELLSIVFYIWKDVVWVLASLQVAVCKLKTFGESEFQGQRILETTSYQRKESASHPTSTFACQNRVPPVCWGVVVGSSYFGCLCICCWSCDFLNIRFRDFGRLGIRFQLYAPLGVRFKIHCLSCDLRVSVPPLVRRVYVFRSSVSRVSVWFLLPRESVFGFCR